MPFLDAVLFASYCGLSRSTPEGQLQRPNRTELDRRCTSIEGAVRFAKANNLLGVLLDATIVVSISETSKGEIPADGTLPAVASTVVDRQYQGERSVAGALWRQCAERPQSGRFM